MFSYLYLRGPGDKPDEKIAATALIGPSDEFYADRVEIKPDYLVRLKSGETIYFGETVYYDDIFGVHHWTRMTYEINPSFKIALAPQGNECDANILDVGHCNE